MRSFVHFCRRTSPGIGIERDDPLVELSGYKKYSHKRTPKKNMVDVRLNRRVTGVNYMFYWVAKNSNCLLMSNVKTRKKCRVYIVNLNSISSNKKVEREVTLVLLTNIP